MVPESSPNIEIGDVVEMRFAHKSVKGPFVVEIFPVKERDKITMMVSKAGSTLAQDYQRRILARAAATGADQPTDIALWKALPFDRAIKIVRGNGKRQMAVFSDPYCAACQAFEQTLQQIDDVTLYVFMLPVIRPDKTNQSKSVWCSPDRAKAWTDLTLNRKVPEAAPDCDNPVDSLMALIQPIGIRATPTMVFENGQRGQGNMLASVLRERLARAETAGGRQASAN
jgi:predicted DsbA family dithiol-disulfide isomerase